MQNVKGTITFNNGERMKEAEEAQYLGSVINERGDPAKEISKRLRDTMITWRRLSEFWKHANCSVRTKLNIYDAMIRAKL
eukprot:10920245-Lingulodinium_polyedra.AAC.1